MVRYRQFMVFLALLAVLSLLAFLILRHSLVPDRLFFLGFEIHLYSAFFAIGILTAYIWTRRQAEFKGFSLPDFDGLFLAALLGGFIGARLFFVWGHWPYFSEHPELIVQVWQGGLAFYGGLIGGIISVIVFGKIKKIKWLEFFDLSAIGLALGQAIGRWGNFFNKEAFGGPAGEFWSIYIPEWARPVQYTELSFYQPTFFYEFLGLLLVAGILAWRWQKGRRFSGEIIALYAILAGTLRFLIEFLRLDALVWQGVYISQIAALVLVLGGVGMYAYNFNQKNKISTN